MEWLNVIKTIAPTVATALGSPLAGAAVIALGSLFGITEPTQDKIKSMIEQGQMTSDMILEMKKLELTYQNDERERDFKYADLAFKDRDSARQANVSGGTQTKLFWLSLMLLFLCLGSEIWILFNGYPSTVDALVLGRILGLLDAVTMLVLAYWYGTTNGSAMKNNMLSATK